MKTQSVFIKMASLVSVFGFSALAAADPAVAPAPRHAAPATSTPLSLEPRGDFVHQRRPNRPLLLSGSLLLGSSYAASTIVAASSNRKADQRLFLPVVGPWLDLKDRNCSVDPCGKDGVNKALLVGDGTLQGLGAVTILLSLVVPESTKTPWYLIGNEKLSVRPQVGTAVTGLTAAGKF